MRIGSCLGFGIVALCGCGDAAKGSAPVGSAVLVDSNHWDGCIAAGDATDVAVRCGDERILSRGQLPGMDGNVLRAGARAFFVTTLHRDPAAEVVETKMSGKPAWRTATEAPVALDDSGKVLRTLVVIGVLEPDGRGTLLTCVARSAATCERDLNALYAAPPKPP